MSESESAVHKKACLGKMNAMHQNFLNIGELLLRPARFYERLSRDRGYGPALGFLFFSSILFSILASIFILQKRALFGLIFFINAFTMPPIMALILFLVTLLGCKNVFYYRILFGITAYSNITLILAWIPGLSWVAGLWKFYLIGLGMVKLGEISSLKAFMVVAVTAAILFSLIYFLQPIMRP